MEELDQFAIEGPHFFPDDMITDQPERQIVAELIREKALKCLNEEIPHGIAVVIDSMKYRESVAKPNVKYEYPGIYDIDDTIICERDSHKGIIIGKGGQMLKKIGTYAREDLEQMLDCKVNLKIWVKVKEDWLNNENIIKKFKLNQYKNIKNTKDKVKDLKEMKAYDKKVSLEYF